jgi:hypothetical protein
MQKPELTCLRLTNLKLVCGANLGETLIKGGNLRGGNGL